MTVQFQWNDGTVQQGFCVKHGFSKPGVQASGQRPAVSRYKKIMIKKIEKN